MRTITKKITAYKFNELKKDIQEKIIYSEFNDYSYSLEDDIKTYLSECLELDYDNLAYSLSNSQGDGITFTLNSLDYEKIKDDPYFKSYKKSHLKYFCDNFHIIVDFEKINHYYSHENSYSVSFNEFNFVEYETCNHRVKLFLTVLDDITSDFQDYYKNMLCDIYSKANNFKDDYNSFEYIDELCEGNDYEFTEDGKLI